MTKRVNDRAAELVGAEVKRLRTAREWSLRKLAEAAGLDFGYVGKIERGESASLDTYQRIAQALGISLSALFAALNPRTRGARRDLSTHD